MKRAPIYEAADHLISVLHSRALTGVIAEKSVETDVNGIEAAGFTMIYCGERYNVNVTKQVP
jgi:hypothetical protein